MKIVNLSAAAAAMLVFPVVFCSCSTGPEKEKKAEPEVPVKEAKAEPAAIEVKAEPVLDNSNKLLGVITAKSIIEVVDDEMGEDYARLAGLVQRRLRGMEAGGCGSSRRYLHGTLQ